MKPIIVTKAFDAAPLGHTVEHFKVGDEVTGRAAEIAIEMGCADKPKTKMMKKPLENKDA